MDRVTIAAQFQHTADRFLASLTVENHRSEAIYLIDVAFRVGPGGLTVRPDHLEVGFLPPATVVLASRLRPPPSGTSTAVPVTLYATPVAPGTTHHLALGTFWPLRQQGWTPPVVGPGGQLVGRPSHEVRCSRVRLELGAIPYDEGLNPQPELLAGRNVARLSSVAFRSQEILQVEVARSDLVLTVLN